MHLIVKTDRQEIGTKKIQTHLTGERPGCYAIFKMVASLVEYPTHLNYYTSLLVRVNFRMHNVVTIHVYFYLIVELKN